MAFFPETFNPRDPVIAGLDLCALDTPDGTIRLMIGQDGQFTDLDGNVWTGSQLVGLSSLQSAIDGIAPAGSLTLSFFQDPDAPALISQIRELGADYVNGYAIRFYVQPLNSFADFYAPTIAPLMHTTRVMRTVSFAATGAQDRSISVSFEAWSADRRSARRLIMNTEGHAALIGEANPSLEFMPTSDWQEEKLFG